MRLTEEIKLREWINANRFLCSPYTCPQCDGEAYEDRWPPNYGGGSSSFDMDGGLGESESEYGGSIKHVCKNCRISFVVSTYEKRKGCKVVEHKENYSNIKPLVEKDGIWLTPNDVRREEYKDEHGEYPVEAYG